VGRAFAWSLAAHAAFIISFLLLSTTRQTLTLPQVARPVRLVTYLEPAAAPRQRASVPVTAAAPQAAAIPPPIAAAAATPVVAPRIVIPVRGQEPIAARTPAPPAETRPALSERLARRLASAIPPESHPVEIATPQVTGLPPPEKIANAPLPDQVVPGALPASQESIVPVGYFPHAWYLAVLKDGIFARWTPPSDYFRSSRPPAALVSFRIDRAGGIGGITLKEGSGSARFDKSALAAIQSLGRVSALPEQYAGENLNVVIRFQNQR